MALYFFVVLTALNAINYLNDELFCVLCDQYYGGALLYLYLQMIHVVMFGVRLS